MFPKQHLPFTAWSTLYSSWRVRRWRWSKVSILLTINSIRAISPACYVCLKQHQHMTNAARFTLYGGWGGMGGGEERMLITSPASIAPTHLLPIPIHPSLPLTLLLSYSQSQSAWKIHFFLHLCIFLDCYRQVTAQRQCLSLFFPLLI